MAHVQHTSNIGRWYHNGVRLPFIGSAVKISLVKPMLVPACFYFVGYIIFRKFHFIRHYRPGVLMIVYQYVFINNEVKENSFSFIFRSFYTCWRPIIFCLTRLQMYETPIHSNWPMWSNYWKYICCLKLNFWKLFNKIFVFKRLSPVSVSCFFWLK